MNVIGTLEFIPFDQRKCSVQKKFSQTMLTLMTFLLWISPGLGDDKPPDCAAQDIAFCSSPCTYLNEKCNGNRECTVDLCSYLFPQLPSRELERCWDLPSICTGEFNYARKRGILNKNVAYLLLKLHPFVNQTSQFGFLTSGRFRRITGNFGTEFLGKRSNTKSSDSRSSMRGNSQNTPKPKTIPTPKFYSLPLNKFAKSKVLKRGDDDISSDFREKRLSIRGSGRVILGSEFLGKRGYQQDGRSGHLEGTEFLGKRTDDPFDGSEFLGKRMSDSVRGVLGKRQREPVSGTELLGKKSSQYSGGEVKRFGNELLGKRISENSCRGSFCSDKKGPELGFPSDYDPELVDETFSSFETAPQIREFGLNFCRESSGLCAKLKWAHWRFQFNIMISNMGDRPVHVESVFCAADLLSNEMMGFTIDHDTQKYPFCIVWTPIPLLTWFFPFIGHMGIGMSNGVIRDFAGPYYVGTGNMAFGKPTKYWQLNPALAAGGQEGWDKAVTEASDVYKNRRHHLLIDNCHSHVALAMRRMKYNDSSCWNMVKLALIMFFRGKYVGLTGFLLSWVPFFIVLTVILLMYYLT